QERQDAALTTIVRPHHHDQVLEGDQERERPEDEGEDAVDVLGGDIHASMGSKALLQGVERAGADVTVHHAEGGERERGQPLPRRRGPVAVRLAHAITARVRRQSATLSRNMARMMIADATHHWHTAPMTTNSRYLR